MQLHDQRCLWLFEAIVHCLEHLHTAVISVLHLSGMAVEAAGKIPQHLK